jgi:hypothetical protein
MNAFGVLLGFVGAVGMAAGLFMESAVGRVANLDLMNFKLLMMTGGGAIFVAGCVLFGANARHRPLCKDVRVVAGRCVMKKTITFLPAALIALPVHAQACNPSPAVTVPKETTVCLSPRGVRDSLGLTLNEAQLKSIGCFTAKNSVPADFPDWPITAYDIDPIRVLIKTPDRVLPLYVKCSDLRSRQ